MLLTITTTHEPADELGYLLAKHPDRVHRASLPFGEATVFFPEVSPTACTAALLVEVDPIGLVRRAAGAGKSAPDGLTLGQHVNDRPYAASSMLSVAIARTLGSALGGRCRERPELAATPIPLELAVPAVRDADELAGRMFEPLGWRVERTVVSGTHVGLRLTGTHRLADALAHAYLLLPVLDDAWARGRWRSSAATPPRPLGPSRRTAPPGSCCPAPAARCSPIRSRCSPPCGPR